MNELSYLPSVLTMLCASVFVVVFMSRLHLSPVLGYLIVGAVIGQYGLRWVQDNEYTSILAEFGVVFLLFVIGLELTFERLIKMRLYVFGFGSLQILLSSGMLTFAIIKLFDLSIVVSAVIASTLALSSTAIVLQIINEGKRAQSKVGKLSLATLLMQDFAVVPLLAIMPIIADGSKNLGSAIGLAVFKALVAIVVITIIGRLFLRPFFSVITSTKNDEVYVTTALLVVLGSSWITSEMQLSNAMGAFLAGLLIAETEYRNKIETSIMPFQGLFLALFFLTVGMSVDATYIIQHLNKIILLSCVILLIKIVAIFLLCKLFRFSYGVSIHLALLLSQVSEFAFILFSLLGQYNIIDIETQQLFMMSVALTMAVTPLLEILGAKVEERLDVRGGEGNYATKLYNLEHLSHHVIIVGFGRIGRIVAYMLSNEQIDYVAIDKDQGLVAKSRRDGFEVYAGDICDHEVLEAINTANASIVVLCLGDKFVSTKLTKILHTDYPNVNVLARVDDYRDAKLFKKLGADVTVPLIIEAGIQMGAETLAHLAVIDSHIVDIKKRIRRDNYNAFEQLELFKGVIWDK